MQLPIMRNIVVQFAEYISIWDNLAPSLFRVIGTRGEFHRVPVIITLWRSEARVKRKPPAGVQWVWRRHQSSRVPPEIANI